jgi:hypothetical protein
MGTHLTPVKMAVLKRQVVARLWKKGNPGILLMERYAITENNID